MRKVLTLSFVVLGLLVSPASADVSFISFDGDCITLQVTTIGEDFVTAAEWDPKGDCETFIGEGRIGKVTVKGITKNIADITGTIDNMPNEATTLDLSFPLVTGGTWTGYQTTGGDHQRMYRFFSGTYTVTDGTTRSPCAGTKRLTDLLRAAQQRGATAPGAGQ